MWTALVILLPLYLAIQGMEAESGFIDNWQSRKSLKECNLHMLTSEDSCDISFRVGKDEKIVRAHRYVLISRSCVFHAMLCGPLAEKDDIKIPDVEPDIFAELLRFLYTDESDPTPANVTALLYLAKKYALGGLEFLCLNYLETSLSAENACVILEQANAFDEKQLEDRALNAIMENGERCLGSRDFLLLSRECFEKVITSDELCVRPEHVFNTALMWGEVECRRLEREVTPVNVRSTLGQLLYDIPFPNMDQTFYVKEVIPKQILTSDENVTVMSSFLCPDSDPSPFKRKQKKTRFLDVVFYSQCKVVGTRKFSGSRIDFTCDHDVLLCGLYLYGSVKDTNLAYHVRVGQEGLFGSLENTKYSGASETNLQDGRIIAVHLKEPVALKKDISYYAYAEVKRTRLPQDDDKVTRPAQFEGDCVQRKVCAGQYTFNKLPVEHNYLGCVNLIHGFIVH